MIANAVEGRDNFASESPSFVQDRVHEVSTELTIRRIAIKLRQIGNGVQREPKLLHRRVISHDLTFMKWL